MLSKKVKFAVAVFGILSLYLPPHAYSVPSPLPTTQVPALGKNACAEFSVRLEELRKGLDSQVGLRQCTTDADCAMVMPLVSCTPQKCREECPWAVNKSHAPGVTKLIESDPYKEFVKDLRQSTLSCPVMVSHCGGLQKPKAACDKATKLCRAVP